MRDRALIPVGVTLYALGAIAWVWTVLGGSGLEGWSLVFAEGAAGHFVAASAFVVLALLGGWVLSGLGWSACLATPFERFLFSWVTGFVLWTFAAALLAAAGLLDARSVATGAGAVALFAAIRGRSAAARFLERWRTSEAASLSRTAAGIALLAGAAYWSWPLLVQTLLPNADWDSATYHLPLAARQLEGVLWNRDPLFSAWSFPGAVSLLYASFMAVGFESAIIPFNFLAALLTLGAVYRIATRLGGEAAGAWGALLLVTTHIFWQLGVDPRVDGLLTLFTAAGCLALAGWLEDRKEPPYLFLLALSINAALGTKYTGLFFGAGMSAVALLALFIPPAARASAPRQAGPQVPVARVSSPRGPRSTGGIVALYLALLVVPNGLWYASNLVLHGDPLFPMLRGDYYRDPRSPEARLPMAGALDPYLASLPEDSAIARATRALEARSRGSVRGNLFDLADMLEHPDEYAVKPNHFTNPLLLVFLFLPIAVTRRRGLGSDVAGDDDASAGRLASLGIYGLGLAFFVGLASQTNLLRYALPVLPALAAGGGVVIASFHHVAWRAAWILGVALLLLHNHRAEVAKLQLLEPSFYATHDGDRLGWLQEVGYNFSARAMPVVTARINREIAAGNLSADDLILMVGEGKGRLLGCDSLPDSGWFRQRWLVELLNADFDHAELLRSLRAQGVTHILYNRPYYDWVIEYTSTPRGDLAAGSVHLERFLRRHGETVFRLEGMELVSIGSEP